MHPRNLYRQQAPNFRQLAAKYEDFRKFTSFAPSGHVRLNFYDPEAVRCLATTLLKEDFKLDVHLPSDALVPRIPARLNYILLIEDLLKSSGLATDVSGIDIGTGPSCIYPMLGSRQCGWNFLATEIDEASYNIASSNVQKNGLQDKIIVFPAQDGYILRDIMTTYRDANFTFTMCNPPFFDKDECESRFVPDSDADFKNTPGESAGSPSQRRRWGPASATKAKSKELYVSGGEVAFIERIIKESIIYQHRIKLFTTLVGKKKSLTPLKQILDDIDHVSFASHMILTGKTARWVLVWTFDPNVKVRTDMIVRPFTVPPVAHSPSAAFKKVCDFGGITLSKPINDAFFGYVDADCLKFRPWTFKPPIHVDADESPPLKRSRPSTMSIGILAKFNDDADAGNLCVAGDENTVDVDAESGEVGIQCCMSTISYRTDRKRYRFVAIPTAFDKINIEIQPSNEPGLRYFESTFRYADRNRSVFMDPNVATKCFVSSDPSHASRASDFWTGKGSL
uniref:U6 small nuclear RNA (adenine-(43)-N(6))-methyltransferase n=1 Tax=Panagrellus redivivus TaxID=6233 RepID=A0A7E5A0C7_PANRE